MKIRVYDSDGVFRGGLFKTHCYNARNCRVWHAPPHPHFDESLIDIAGHDNPCEPTSWYRLQIAHVPDLIGPADHSDDFDANSKAYRITPVEAGAWLERCGFTKPTDLIRLLGERSATPTGSSSESTADPFAPYMPASWFKDKYGISNERLRAAWRTNRICAVKQGKRNLYSVPSVRDEWPEDNIQLPQTSG
ncbi:MAG: hypothetical protein IT435_00010 [Phycisphaerales bacterium]|nr:hypothetical protein [Phycisphaerales bacterium]